MTDSIANDYKDAVLEAQAELMEVMREVIGEFVLPAVQKQAKAMWMQMPDEMKEKFKAERPDEYKAFMEGMKP